jgi:hypothetical protein
MRIGAKNSTPARDRKRFLFSGDAEMALFIAFAQRWAPFRDAQRALAGCGDVRKRLQNKARRALMNPR